MTTVTNVVMEERSIWWATFWARWGTLVPILMLALVLRLGYLPDAAYKGDMEHFGVWVDSIRHVGVFHFYDSSIRFAKWDRTYPQLSTLAFAAIGAIHKPVWGVGTTLHDPAFTAMVKVLPVICELIMIAVVYAWLRGRKTLSWLIPALLALYPGMIATSAWWGQFESPFTLFLILALLALNRDRPVWAWVCFAVAVLFKQPAAALGPVLLVMTFRRYGWRVTLTSILVFTILCAAVLAPFIMASGFNGALAPYLQAADIFPFMQNNAYNFWFALTSIHHTGAPGLFNPEYADAQPLIKGLPFTYKHAGFGMFGLYVLLMMVITWRQAYQRREFVWSAALFMGFFILPTQVHERYIYPAAVLALLAVAQDRRLLWVAIGLLVTFSYNVLGIAIPYKWHSISLGSTYLSFPTALLNIGLLIALTRIALWPQTVESRQANDTKLSTEMAARSFNRDLQLSE